MASKKRRKVNYARLLLLVLIAIALIAVIVLGIRYILKDDTGDNDADPLPSVITNADTKIEVSDYAVYEDKNNDLGFNFVVATLKFTNDNGINYDLSNLKTNEGIELSNILEYSKQLTMASYDFNSLDTTTTIESSNKEYSAKVFIPYKETTNSIIVTDSISNSSLYIDVTSHKVDIDTLKKEDNSTEIVSNDYNISVASNYIASNMYHNGERYDSSMLNTYVFEMTVNSISNGVKITSASFKQTSTGETYQAKDSSYTTSKGGVEILNILDKELKVGDTYALFFEVYGNPDDEPDYKGTITINFSDSSSVTIDTELN